MMDRENVILLTLDEFRPDRIEPYGQKRIKTPFVNRIADDGVLFEKCMAPSCLTPISHAAILTGLHAPHNGFRDPFCRIQAPRIAEIMKDHGYRTAGYVGINYLGEAQGFSAGFDVYDLPDEGSDMWPHRDRIHFGNLWQDKCFDFIRENQSSPFFIWGHYFECHSLTEIGLLKRGLLKEGYLPEFEYYDAKVELMDQKILFKPLLKLLDELDLYEKTSIVVMADHGTSLGEHPAPQAPGLDFLYPTHVFLYDEDIHIPLIIKSRKLPKGKRVPGVVRGVDVVPTILDLVDIETLYSFDGQSLLPIIEAGEAKGVVNYAEEMWGERGPGDFQGIRTDQYMVMIDRRNGDVEEFYDIVQDPGQQNNLMGSLNEEQQLVAKQMRRQLDLYYKAGEETSRVSSEKEKRIRDRLRDLHYI